MKRPKKYTTWGPVRGCCEHEHLTVDAAARCIASDATGCLAQGGYSDRRVRVITARHALRRYDVVRGPGEPLQQ